MPVPAIRPATVSLAHFADPYHAGIMEAMSTGTEMRLEATVTGHVQGVSFRYYTQQCASRLGLTGWVANQPDGTVRVVAEGDRAALDELLAFLHQGPPAARVVSVQAQRSPATGTWEHFRIQQL